MGAWVRLSQPPPTLHVRIGKKPLFRCSSKQRPGTAVANPEPELAESLLRSVGPDARNRKSKKKRKDSHRKRKLHLSCIITLGDPELDGLYLKPRYITKFVWSTPPTHSPVMHTHTCSSLHHKGDFGFSPIWQCGKKKTSTEMFRRYTTCAGTKLLPSPHVHNFLLRYHGTTAELPYGILNSRFRAS